MFWYILLQALTIVFAIIVIGTIIIFILSGCDCAEILLVTLVAIIIAVASGYGVTAIEKANTTTNTDVVQMEITKCDLTTIRSENGIIQQNCYITAGDKYLVEVSAEKYAQLNVGDMVMIEITTKTKFGEVQKPTMCIKGDKV